MAGSGLPGIEDRGVGNRGSQMGLSEGPRWPKQEIDVWERPMGVGRAVAPDMPQPCRASGGWLAGKAARLGLLQARDVLGPLRQGPDGARSRDGAPMEPPWSSNWAPCHRRPCTAVGEQRSRGKVLDRGCCCCSVLGTEAWACCSSSLGHYASYDPIQPGSGRFMPPGLCLGEVVR